MITNPENLSKDRLKAELKKRGISFSSQENKKYYVDLYRKKVMVAESGRSEFSDDDLTNSPGLAKRKGVRGRKSKNELIMSNVGALGDTELMNELTSFGEKPGPINPLTRGVYERKLAKLMQLEGTRKIPVLQKEPEPEPETANDSFIGEWSDEDEDEEKVPDEEVMQEDRGAGVDSDDGDSQESLVSKESDRSTYNLRRRDTPSQESVDRRPRRRSPVKTRPHTPPAPQRPTRTPRKQPPQPRRRSETGRTLWSFFLLVVFIVGAFLLYEHLTVPDGKSLLSAGCDKLHNGVLRMFGPLMARQEVEPGSESAELPREDPKPDKPPPAKKPPKTDPPKDTNDKPKSDPPKDTNKKPKPKDTTDKPKKTGEKAKKPADKPKKKPPPPPPTDKPATPAPPSDKPQTPPKQDPPEDKP